MLAFKLYVTQSEYIHKTGTETNGHITGQEVILAVRMWFVGHCHNLWKGGHFREIKIGVNV